MTAKPPASHGGMPAWDDDFEDGGAVTKRVKQESVPPSVPPSAPADHACGPSDSHPKDAATARIGAVVSV